jgi:hypothetical protein
VSPPEHTDLAEALTSAYRIVTADPRDWTANRHDAFLYGLLRGWDDPASEAAVADKHGWDDQFLERLRRLHSAVERART